MVHRDQVNLLFGGDFAPNARFQELAAKDPRDLWGDAIALIANSDYTVINLELPLCGELGPTSKVGPSIKADPGVAVALSSAGVDAVSLANNHIFDFGSRGLEETLSTLDSQGISHFGAGLDRTAAETVHRVTISGRRISMLAFAEREFNTCEENKAGAAIFDPICAIPAILQERSRADALIVCLHGGNEHFPYPRPQHRRMCQLLIDLGVDAVICHHPHVPGAYELYREKPIFYSLGNLIFDRRHPQPKQWNQGYLARLKLSFNTDLLMNVDFELFPYRQSVDIGGLRLLAGDERTTFLNDIEVMRRNLEDEPHLWLEAWSDFVEKKRLQALIDLSSPLRFPGLRRLLKVGWLRNLVLPPSQRLRRLNMLRCQSHLELVTAALESASSYSKNRFSEAEYSSHVSTGEHFKNH